MGYYVDVECNAFIVDPEGALRELNRMMFKEMAERDLPNIPSNSRRVFSWVIAPREEFSNIQDAMTEWRYCISKVENVPTTQYNVEYFTGEKLGDDETLWRTIAPFCEGSINFHGEDGYLWRYEFEPGKPMVEKFGEIHWV